MDDLDKEADKTHNQKAYTGGLGDLCKLFGVGLGALFDELLGILVKLL